MNSLYVVCVLIGSILLQGICQDFTKREIKIFENNLKRIQQRQVGNVLISMIQFKSPIQQINELIDSAIDDLENDLNSLKEKHSLKQQSYLKQLQGLQNKMIDVSIMIGENDNKLSGPIDSEKQYYSQQIDRLKEEIEKSEQNKAQKVQSLEKLKEQYNNKVRDLDQSIDNVDQILQLIDEINKEESRVGIQFMQKKGRVNSILDDLNKQKVTRNDVSMIKSISAMQLKNNFDDVNSKNQIIQMLGEVRRKIVDEVNKISGDDSQRIDSLNNDIRQLDDELMKMKNSIQEGMEKMNENVEMNEQLERNKGLLLNSQKRIQDEIDLLKEQIKMDNEQYQEKQRLLIEEDEELGQIRKMLKNQEMIKFIQQK